MSAYAPHIHYGEPALEADDPTPVAGTPAERAAEAAWLAVSADLTDVIPELCYRDDLIVKAVAGTSAGAPAMFTPATAVIEIDRALFTGVDPESIRPFLPTDYFRYPAAWGGLVHEAAHAEHSTWTPADVAGHPSNAVAAAVLLEESRIEAAHLAGRPDDRLWLRAGTTTIVWPELSAAGITGCETAAQAAALVLARVDAGILTKAEVAPLRQAVESVLGAEAVAELERVWRAAHIVEDGDKQAMLDLGTAWCRAIGQDPEAEAPTGGRCAHGPADSSAGASAPGSLPGGSEATVGAVTSAAAEVAAAVKADVDATVGDGAEAANRAAEEHVRQVKGERAAKKTFGSSRARIRTRPPTDAERGAAAALAKQLRAASYRDRATTKIAAELPPGRLRMRGAMVRDAQRAAGAMPTAKPFTTTVRRTVQRPPLRVGIAVDTSGSMSCAEGPLSSAAWIVATAVAAADPASATATVGYGNVELRSYTRPGQIPAGAPVIRTGGGDERFCEAVDALDAALGLTWPDAARLLVVVSDGLYFADERRGGEDRVNRLTTAGCAVLWLTLTGASDVIGDATELVIDDLATAGAEIGRAAVKALAAAR